MAAQELLTTAATLVEIAAIALTAFGIVATAFKSPVAAPVQAASVSAIEVSEQVLAQPQPVIHRQPEAPTVASTIAPAIQRSSPRTQSNTRQLSRCERLRKECATRGIQWRNASANGKHLSVRQMQQSLEPVAIA